MVGEGFAVGSHGFSLTSAHMLRWMNSDGISTAMVKARPRSRRASREPGSLLLYCFPVAMMSEMMEGTECDVILSEVVAGWWWWWWRSWLMKVCENNELC